MPGDGSERRRFHRFQIPLVIDALALSDLPFTPEDVSEAGFCLSLEEKPEIGLKVICSLQSGEEMFDGCECTVMWVRKLDSEPPAWLSGFALRTKKPEEQVRLAALLRDLSAKFGKMTCPFI